MVFLERSRKEARTSCHHKTQPLTRAQNLAIPSRRQCPALRSGPRLQTQNRRAGCAASSHAHPCTRAASYWAGLLALLVSSNSSRDRNACASFSNNLLCFNFCCCLSLSIFQVLHPSLRLQTWTQRAITARVSRITSMSARNRERNGNNKFGRRLQLRLFIFLNTSEARFLSFPLKNVF